MTGTRNADEASDARKRSHRMIGGYSSGGYGQNDGRGRSGCSQRGARDEASMGGMTRVMRDLENGIH